MSTKRMLEEGRNNCSVVVFFFKNEGDIHDFADYTLVFFFICLSQKVTVHERR